MYAVYVVLSRKLLCGPGQVQCLCKYLDVRVLGRIFNPSPRLQDSTNYVWYNKFVDTDLSWIFIMFSSFFPNYISQ